MALRFQTAEDFKASLTNEMVYKVTIGRSNCDVVIHGEFVSSRHLDIIWEPQNGEASYKVTIRDHSTNGTGVNGRKIKNESYSFYVNKSIKSLINDSSSLPQVMIAGLADYTLNWEDVLNILFNEMDIPTSVVENYRDDSNINTDSKSTNVQRIGVGYGILSFLFPIVGWILGSVWKTQFPEKAKSANKLACWGFLFNFTISLLLNSVA